MNTFGFKSTRGQPHGNTEPQRKAIELAGKWYPSHPEQWEFDENNYGSTYKSFCRQFTEFSMTINKNGSGTFSYGNLISGDATWYMKNNEYYVQHTTKNGDSGVSLAKVDLAKDSMSLKSMTGNAVEYWSRIK